MGLGDPPPLLKKTLGLGGPPQVAHARKKVNFLKIELDHAPEVEHPTMNYKFLWGGGVTLPPL